MSGRLGMLVQPGSHGRREDLWERGRRRGVKERRERRERRGEKGEERKKRKTTMSCLIENIIKYTQTNKQADAES